MKEKPQIKENPLETLAFDLVVVGGGLAGLCAAIAAARTSPRGTRVAIIQDRPVFGGNASSEVRVAPHGANQLNTWAGETGIMHAVLLEERATNHVAYAPMTHGLINSIYDLALIEAARRESNLTFFLNTTVRAVESIPLAAATVPTPTLNGLGRLGGESRRIVAVHASQMGSEKELRFTAKQFIDSTGDGTVGFFAGADFRYGREARHEFNETLAPLVSDDTTMGSSIMMLARDIGRPVKYDPPPWIQLYKKHEEIGFCRPFYNMGKAIYGGFWWLEVGNPYHQIRDNAEIRQEVYRHVLGVWNFIKNYSDFRDKAANYALDWIGMVPGKRESRRLVGDVTLTEHHCHTDQRWPDAIGYAGYWIDVHSRGGILNKIDPPSNEIADLNHRHWVRVPVHTLPLRCFYSRNIENLWMACRCLSTTHVALGTPRLMLTMAQLGHGVGIAAAYALEHGLTPRQTANPDGPHIAPLQQKMLREDVRIPGLRNSDPGDLARGAAVSATSEALLDLSLIKADTNLKDAERGYCDPGTPAEWYDLGSGSQASPALAMVVPLTQKRIKTLEFFLRNQGKQSQRLAVSIQRLERIWDRIEFPVVAASELIVPASTTGWVTAKLNATIMPGHPYRIILSGGEGIAWAACADWPVGTNMQYLYVSPGGPEPKNTHLPCYNPSEIVIPAYRHWRQLKTALAMRITPSSAPYDGKNVTNDCAWPEALPNLWRSDPAAALPQHVELRFPRPTSLNCVEVSFDTNLARPLEWQQAFFRAPECARDWQLLAETSEGWKEVHGETDNYFRKRRVSFPRIVANALRLVITATNGGQEARIYEIRVYDEV
jgi:hypothetical protein